MHASWTPKNQSNGLTQRKESSCQKCLYLAKSAHELKNILISISSFIQNNIETSSNKSSLATQQQFTEKESNFFWLHLWDFGMYLIHDINIIASQSYGISNYNNTEETVTEFSLVNAWNFCLKIFQYRQKFENRNITVSSSIAISMDKKIKCISEKRLRQVIINLLSNSYKFTKEAGEIRLSCFNIPNNKIRIKISDTGPGFKESDWQHLFQPFHVIERNQALNKNGSGLGLCIVKDILESYGSKICFSSNQTVGGCEFWFDLSNDVKEVTIIDPNEKITNSLKKKMTDINEGGCDGADDEMGDDRQNLVDSKELLEWSFSNNNNCSGDGRGNTAYKGFKTEKSANSKGDDQGDNRTNAMMNNNEDNGDFKDELWDSSQNDFTPIHKMKGNIPRMPKSTLNVYDNIITNSSGKAYSYWAATEAILPNYSQLQNLKKKKTIKKQSKAIDDFDSLNKIKNYPLHNQIRKIIVCDDQQWYREMIKNQITKLYKNNWKLDKVPEIYCTKNGVECWYWAYQNYVKGTPINIIILDENWEYFFRGSEVCFLMKGLKEMNEIKIYLMSAGLITDTNTKADGIFEKPLNVNDIIGIWAK